MPSQALLRPQPNDTLARPRLHHLLDRDGSARVILIAGAPGFGKSVLLRDYAAARRGVYLRIERGESAACARQRVAEALGVGAARCAAHSGLIKVLHGLGPSLLLIDDADAGAPDWLDAMNALFEDAPENIRFVVAARSRDVVRDARLFVEGVAARLPAQAFAFSLQELAELCDLRGVSYAAKDLDALIGRTAGWPIIVNACVRLAATQGHGLGGAFDHWCAAHRSTFSDYVLQEAGRAGKLATFQRVLSAKGVTNGADFESLERAGLFVEFDGRQFAVFRALRDILSSPDGASYAVASLPPLPMTVHVLGEFETWIGNRRIKWLRRRDAQIFKYVLLKPDGRASRDELLDAFWPGRDRQLAAQALRTACSNIRHALCDVIGSAQAACYFRANGEICVARENIVLDLQSFTSHVTAARAAALQDDASAAISHLESARELYHGSLIADVPEAHYAQLAADIDRTYASLDPWIDALRDASSAHSYPQAVRRSASSPIATVSSRVRRSPSANALRRAAPAASSTTVNARR